MNILINIMRRFFFGLGEGGLEFFFLVKFNLLNSKNKVLD